MSRLKTLQRLASKIHVWLYRKTGGRFASMGDTVVVVTTTGAKSGAKRTNPLVAYPHGDRWIVVAAAGGSRNPGWYHNMVAHPDVILEKGADQHQVVARQATGDERTALWSTVIEREPSYASFQRKAGRTIPIMILEPTRTPGPVLENE